MSNDTIAYGLIWLAVLPATLFPIIYFFRPWWRSLAGRALMTSSLGLALLIDISLAYKVFGNDYPGRDAVRLTVYALIVAGSWMILFALFRAGGPGRRRSDDKPATWLDPHDD